MNNDNLTIYPAKPIVNMPAFAGISRKCGEMARRGIAVMMERGFTEQTFPDRRRVPMGQDLKYEAGR